MENKRNTIQRQAVLESVKELNIHATAEQVYDHVVQKYPSISKATVYRNLSQMVESGELLNIGSFYGSQHYDHNLHHHYHFVCEVCRQVYDIETYFPDLTANITGMEGFEINDHLLTFTGLCKACKSRDINI